MEQCLCFGKSCPLCKLNNANVIPPPHTNSLNRPLKSVLKFYAFKQLQTRYRPPGLLHGPWCPARTPTTQRNGLEGALAYLSALLPSQMLGGESQRTNGPSLG